MSDSYTNAPACKMLATHCVCCGRPLLDARSVEMGIGPECRNGALGDIPEDLRKVCNRLTYQASIFAQQGEVQKVLDLVEQIEDLGLDKLAKLIKERFTKYEKKVEITITEENGTVYVQTPLKRKNWGEMVADWRSIPGRRYRDGKNSVPRSEKHRVLELLKKHYAGRVCKGPKGIFVLPKPPTQNPRITKLMQDPYNLTNGEAEQAIAENEAEAQAMVLEV